MEEDDRKKNRVKTETENVTLFTSLWGGEDILHVGCTEGNTGQGADIRYKQSKLDEERKRKCELLKSGGEVSQNDFSGSFSCLRSAD